MLLHKWHTSILITLGYLHARDPTEPDHIGAAHCPIESDHIQSNPIDPEAAESDPIEPDPIESASCPKESNPIESVYYPIQSDQMLSNPIVRYYRIKSLSHHIL